MHTSCRTPGRPGGQSALQRWRKLECWLVAIHSLHHSLQPGRKLPCSSSGLAKRSSSLPRSGPQLSGQGLQRTQPGISLR